MKTSKKVSLVVVLMIFVFAACEKADEFNVNTIEGRYIGTLTEAGSLKSAGGVSSVATTDITKTSKSEIQVHCYGDEIDTTFMLNYFENHDSVMVCLNGENFANMYGHMMGAENMSGGMMGNHSNNSSGWANHMNDEHRPGDEHFGGFDMMGKSFGYTFRMQTGDLHFQGTKK